MNHEDGHFLEKQSCSLSFTLKNLKISILLNIKNMEIHSDVCILGKEIKINDSNSKNIHAPNNANANPLRTYSLIFSVRTYV
jgi:hypothetical protein